MQIENDMGMWLWYNIDSYDTAPNEVSVHECSMIAKRRQKTTERQEH